MSLYVNCTTVFLSSKLAFSTKLPHFTAELLDIHLALSSIHKTNYNFHILFSQLLQKSHSFRHYA